MTIRGFVNLRDVGGLPLVGGGVTAHGVLYRGDAPYPGDSVLPELVPWPPHTVIDLRGKTERDRFVYGWPAETVVHHMPLFDSAAPGARPVDLPSLYTRILHYNETRAGEILARVAEREGAVLLHCTAGKDRTGVLVTVLLLAAGVEPEAVVDDYVRSEESLFDLIDRWLDVGVRTRNSPPLAEQFLRAPAEAIAPIVEQLTSVPGGPAQWMLDHGADPAHLETWRARMHGVIAPVITSAEGRTS